MHLLNTRLDLFIELVLCFLNDFRDLHKLSRGLLDLLDVLPADWTWHGPFLHSITIPDVSLLLQLEDLAFPILKSEVSHHLIGTPKAEAMMAGQHRAQFKLI